MKTMHNVNSVDPPVQSKPVNYDLFYLSIYDIEKNISKLNNCCDHYGIHANHLKYGDKSLYYFLSSMFNSFLRHTHVPFKMLLGEIHPIIKNKFGNKNDPKNFRPIIIF